MVFIGRLHPQYKGLDMLVDAAALARAELTKARAEIVLCGPDCNGSAKMLAKRIAAEGLEDLVTLHGPVMDDAKTELLSRADVFLHPSRSEGHPMAVLEALAHGVPCLLTRVTNVAEEVAAAGAGWIVEPTTGAIAAGLKGIAAVGKNELAAAGVEARRLASRRYRWKEAAAGSIELYRRHAA